MTILAVITYAFAMVFANAVIAEFGPWVSPINSFFLVGLTLALRDWLHTRLTRWQMGALIAVSGLLTWVLNAAPAQIAAASAISFAISATVDWLVFTYSRGSWMRRALKSNLCGAAVDSLLFPTLAFGVFMPWIVLAQFASKSIGGAVWTWILGRRLARAA